MCIILYIRLKYEFYYLCADSRNRYNIIISRNAVQNLIARIEIMTYYYRDEIESCCEQNAAMQKHFKKIILIKQSNTTQLLIIYKREFK